MVTVTAGLAIDLNDDDEGTTSVGFRRALAILLRQSSPGVATPGRMGADHFVVSGAPAAMEYTVSGGGLVIVRTASGGAYLIGMPSSVTCETDPADGVNPRIDRIYAKQPDPPLDGSAVNTEFIIDVVSGAAAASPLPPDLPAGGIELARKEIGAGATNTQSGKAFTNILGLSGLNVGVITVAQGGTGSTNPADARAALGMPTIYSGSGAPANTLGRDGDVYFQPI
ncbi:hypothetical protein [Microbacterium sp. cx-59]|uniref:hypothetical protein n=1 Tax=Microbacterium sp. cx-59 TaxID=2891207 RepID=UPI001E46266A|nr:hypothetical protein [Microbacterium sp. cx-59]MCC4906978.1 hypothetical protein [Microbacterium sp. cx-59]